MVVRMTGPDGDRLQRAVIVFTDIVGYTRMMGENQPRTIGLLKMHAKMVAERVEEHGGRVLERIGDAFMLRFDHAAEAVRCALAIQKDLAEYNRKARPAEQLHVRIGIHSGEIVERDHELFGSVINIAARVQPLALPDGITITRGVYDEASSKCTVPVENMGPTTLKNVTNKVEVLHLVTDQVGREAVAKELAHRRDAERRYRFRFGLSVGAGLLLLVLMVLFFRMPELFGYEKAEAAGEALPANRIAVMPLRNVTGDSANNYICEGVAEDLIFKLMKVQGIHVYSLADIMALDKENRTTRGIKRNLGARYLVQGSLFRADDSLSVRIEVVDTETSQRLFSEGYAEAREQRMSLQDKIARDMLFPIVGRISGEAEASLALHTPANQVASDFYLQARHAQRNATSWSDYQNMLRLYESAVQADSQFALAHAQVAAAYVRVHGQWDNDRRWVELGKQHAATALTLAPDLPEAYLALGLIHVKENDFDEAEQDYLKALSLRPDHRTAFNGLGGLYLRQSRFPEAMSLYERALEAGLEMGDLQGQWFATHYIGHIHASRGNLEQALDFLGKAIVLARETGSKENEATTLNRIGVVYKWKGDYLLAIQAYEKALSLQREINDLAGQSVTLNSIGSFHYTRGEYDKALDYYKQGLEIRTRVGAYLRPAYNNIGATFNSMGQPDSALVYQQKALVIARESDDPRGEGYALENLGYIYRNSGMYREALDHFTQSLRIDRELGLRRGQGYSLAAIASTYRRMGEFQSAISYFRESLALREEIGDKRNVALTRGWIADVYTQMSTPSWALEELYQALPLWKEMEETDQVQRTLLRIAEGRYQLGDYEAARDTLQLLLQPDVPEDFRPYTQLLMAACDVREGHVDNGLKRMRDAIEVMVEQEDYSGAADGYLVLARCLVDLDRHEEADAALTSCLYIAAKDHLNDRAKVARQLQAELAAP